MNTAYYIWWHSAADLKLLSIWTHRDDAVSECRRLSAQNKGELYKIFEMPMNSAEAHEEAV
jgi:hypothetical protein